MKKKTFQVLLFWIILVSMRPVDLHPQVVVTSKWLENNLGKPDVVVLQISNILKDYENGHVPGSGFLWPGWITESNESESTVPADLKKIEKKLRELGISNNSHVVLSGKYGNLVTVCRIYVTLEHFGMEGRVSIHQGGYEDWVESGGTVSVEPVIVGKGKLNLTQNGSLVNGDWMKNNYTNNNYVIIDARTKQYYDGDYGSARKGHIPGARNLPSGEFYNSKTNHFLPAEQILKKFESISLEPGKQPVFYCNSGNLASIGYVAARIAGFKPLLYDGSMEDWGSRFDQEIETNTDK